MKIYDIMLLIMSDGIDIIAPDPVLKGWKSNVAICFLAQLLSIIGFSLGDPFLVFFVRNLDGVALGMAPRIVGNMIMFMSLSLAVMAPVWGILADRYGRKTMVLRALFGGAVAISLLGGAHSVFEIYVYKVIQGIFTGSIMAFVVLVSSNTPKEHKGFSLGLMAMATYFGSALGPLTGGELSRFLAARFMDVMTAYRIAFIISGFILFFAGLIVLLFVREQFEPQSTSLVALKEEVGVLFKIRPFWLMIFVLASIRFSMSIPRPVFPLLVEQFLSNPAAAGSVTGRVMAGLGIMLAISAVISGKLSDRFGYKRNIALGLLLAGLSSFPQATAHSLAQLMFWRLVYAAAIAGVIPAANALISNIVPQKTFGKSYGIVTSMTIVAIGLGPMTGGWLAAAFNVRVPFATVGVVMIPLALMIFGMDFDSRDRPRGKRPWLTIAWWRKYPPRV